VATMKCTALFLFTTTDTNKADGNRSAGWSESYYYPTADFAVAANQFGQLCRCRAGLLATGGSIIGQRYQLVDPVGASKSGAVGFTGNSGAAADVPQMALLITAEASGTTNKRSLIVRGVPDARVVGGNYSPSTDYDRRLGIFYAGLRNGWVMRGANMGNQKSPIISIDTTGVVTTSIAHGLAAEQRVQILRTIMPNDRQKGGVYTVMAPVTATTFKIAADFTLPTHGGKARKYEIVNPNYGACELQRVVVKKVGRVFFPYRGRASVRR